MVTVATSLLLAAFLGAIAQLASFVRLVFDNASAVANHGTLLALLHLHDEHSVLLRMDRIESTDKRILEILGECKADVKEMRGQRNGK